MSIKGPLLLIEESFQKGWLAAAQELCHAHWEIQNLFVTITDASLFDGALNQNFETFSKENGILRPKAVAYTIFPHKLYQTNGNAEKLFQAYNRPRGFYQRIKRNHEWGTYFRRMTHYETTAGAQNQLKNIIGAINEREKISCAAYTLVIQKPGGETIRPLGGPCLNYLAVQLNREERKLGLLAVYRNHDFLERAYGNYWGLCNLIKFMAKETAFNPGALTCVSSHAYVPKKRGAFKAFVESPL